MRNYLKVNYDGTIFQYSKDEKEGYEKFTNKANKVSYRKYFKTGVTGVLTSAELRNNQFLNNAEELRLTLTDGEVENILTFPVLNQDGTSLDDYTESMSLILPKMVKGNTYTVNNYFLKKGDKIKGETILYSKKGVTVKSNDVKVKSDLTFTHVKNRGTAEESLFKGDVPMLLWKPIAGKNRPTAASKEIRLEYLYTLMTDQVARISNGVAKAQPQNKVAEPVKVITKEERDELPF